MKKKNIDEKSPFYIINLGTLDNPVLKYCYNKIKKD